MKLKIHELNNSIYKVVSKTKMKNNQIFSINPIADLTKREFVLLVIF